MENKILELLKGSTKTNKEIREALGLDAEKYDTKLDRILQKLRKEKKIQSFSGKWALASFKICDKCGGKGWTP